MRWLIGLSLTALLLIAGDTAVRIYAQNTVASRLERDLSGEGSFEVTLGGFPFVAGLLAGRIPEAELVAEDVERGGLRIDRLTIDIEGLHVSLVAADAGTGNAEVEWGQGTAVLRVGVLARFIESRGDVASVRIDEDGIRVRIPQMGRAITAPLRLERGRLVIGTPAIEDVIVPLPGALSDIRYETISVSGDRARLTFRLNNVELRSL
jgi:hypothetical protein